MAVSFVWILARLLTFSSKCILAWNSSSLEDNHCRKSWFLCTQEKLKLFPVHCVEFFSLNTEFLHFMLAHAKMDTQFFLAVVVEARTLVTLLDLIYEIVFWILQAFFLSVSLCFIS